MYTMTITNVVSGCVTTDGVNVSANFIVPNAEAGSELSNMLPMYRSTCKAVQLPQM
ncbi:MAG: hypothetical protein U0T32_07510 [Chitinophagales bacterium]